MDSSFTSDDLPKWSKAVLDEWRSVKEDMRNWRPEGGVETADREVNAHYHNAHRQWTQVVERYIDALSLLPLLQQYATADEMRAAIIAVQEEYMLPVVLATSSIVRAEGVGTFASYEDFTKVAMTGVNFDFLSRLMDESLQVSKLPEAPRKTPSTRQSKKAAPRVPPKMTTGYTARDNFSAFMSTLNHLPTTVAVAGKTGLRDARNLIDSDESGSEESFSDYSTEYETDVDTDVGSLSSDDSSSAMDTTPARKRVRDDDSSSEESDEEKVQHVAKRARVFARTLSEVKRAASTHPAQFAGGFGAAFFGTAGAMFAAGPLVRSITSSRLPTTVPKAIGSALSAALVGSKIVNTPQAQEFFEMFTQLMRFDVSGLMPKNKVAKYAPLIGYVDLLWQMLTLATVEGNAARFAISWATQIAMMNLSVLLITLLPSSTAGETTAWMQSLVNSLLYLQNRDVHRRRSGTDSSGIAATSIVFSLIRIVQAVNKAKKGADFSLENDTRLTRAAVKEYETKLAKLMKVDEKLADPKSSKKREKTTDDDDTLVRAEAKTFKGALVESLEEVIERNMHIAETTMSGLSPKLSAAQATLDKLKKEIEDVDYTDINAVRELKKKLAHLGSPLYREGDITKRDAFVWGTRTGAVAGAGLSFATMVARYLT